MRFKNPFTAKTKKELRKSRLITDYKKSPQWGEMSTGQKSLYKRYRRSAESRGKQFKIGLLHFCNLTSSNCFYCGTKPQQVSGNLLYNGIDRVDNNTGYEYGNVISCCGKCNKAKGTMSFVEFSEWIHQVSSEYNMRKSELSSGAVNVEYFASRGFSINPKLYTLKDKILSSYKEHIHNKPSRIYIKNITELIKNKVIY